MAYSKKKLQAIPALKHFIQQLVYGQTLYLKDYKINPNEFKIIPNLIYVGLDLVLFPLLCSLPAIKSPLVLMQHHLALGLSKLIKHFAKLTAEILRRKCMCMHVQIPLCKSKRKLLYTDGGKMVQYSLNQKCPLLWVTH